MKSYSKEQFAKDVIAGIIVAIIALPLSIALALASGVGPEQGLYTAIVAGFVISLLGGSRVQIAGPTAAFASIVAGIIATHGFDGLVIATIMAGIILILMGLLGLGNLIKFIPRTITVGFTSGIAVTIAIGQVKDFLGLTFTNSPVETMEKAAEVVHSISTINFEAAFIGILALAIMIVTPKFLKKVPPSIIAIIICSAAVKIFDMNVLTIGELYKISSALPKFTTPAFTPDTLLAVLPNAFTIAVLAAVESLLSCVVADGMISSRHNSNTELIAQGAGNIFSALFGGIPATGAIARTAANIKNGGRTPIAGMVHAIVLLIVLVSLMPYASIIPMPVIAAILFVVAYNMSEWREFTAILKTMPKSDIFVLLLTFVLTIAFDLVVAIAAGFILASIMFMKRMADVTSVSSWVSDEEAEDIRFKKIPNNTFVYEIIGPVFFGAAEKISDLVRSAKNGVVIIRMRSVPAIDATGLHALDTIIKRCRKKNVTIIMSHVNEQPMKALSKSGIYDEIGSENFCENIDMALERAEYLTTDKG